MASFFPAEAENIIAKLMFGKTPNLELGTPGVYKLGLFSSVTGGLSNTTLLSDVIEIAAAGNPGYAAKTTDSASWVVAGSTASYPPQTFTAGVGGWASTVRGYYIATIPSGAASGRLLFIQEDGTYNFVENSTYEVTLNISLA